MISSHANHLRESWNKMKQMSMDKLIYLHHQKESQGKLILKTEKDPEEAKKAGAKNWLNQSRMHLLRVSWRQLK